MNERKLTLGFKSTGNLMTKITETDLGKLKELSNQYVLVGKLGLSSISKSIEYLQIVKKLVEENKIKNISPEIFEIAVVNKIQNSKSIIYNSRRAVL